MKLGWRMKFAVTAAIMGGLYGADTWLARLEDREVSAAARHRYLNGQRLLLAKRPDEAIPDFQKAHYLVRRNRAYELALADALLRSGKTPESIAILSESLDRDSNDGEANLLMARAMRDQKNGDGAESYYHRSIYGEWPGTARAKRLEVRLELASLLVEEGRKQELLSEVLLLANEAGPADRVAELYLEAGSAARAAAAYRAILRSNPGDVRAHLGLGRAELLAGNFRAAHTAFGSAARLAPEDEAAAHKLELAERLEALDPTPRHLSSAEKFRRSREVLYLSVDAAAGCPLGDLVARAEKLRGEKISAAPANELAEARLALAGEIWRARAQACGPPHPDSVLAILFAKLEQ